MVLTWQLQAVNDFRENGFLELTGKVEAFLIVSCVCSSMMGGERVERVACETEVRLC